VVSGVVGFGLFASVMKREWWSRGIVVVRWREKAGIEVRLSMCVVNRWELGAGSRYELGQGMIVRCLALTFEWGMNWFVSFTNSY
jgi:hypothetical protein